MRTLGIIGGLGPLATAYFYRRVVELTPAATDQEHIETWIRSCPQIPDRTAFLLGESAADPRPKMIEAGRSLVSCGADVLAIPCITAHAFHKDLEEGIGHPILHAIRELGEVCRKRGIRNLGIMATDGARKSGIYDEILEEAGITCIWPEEPDQARVMHMIYDDVKAGRILSETDFRSVGNALSARGAEGIVLGCTELSQATVTMELDPVYIDIIDVLAEACVRECRIAKKKRGLDHA